MKEPVKKVVRRIIILHILFLLLTSVNKTTFGFGRDTAYHASQGFNFGYRQTLSGESTLTGLEKPNSVFNICWCLNRQLSKKSMKYLITSIFD